MNDRNNLNKVIANDRQETLRKEEIVNEVNQSQADSQTNFNKFKDEREPFKVPEKFRIKSTFNFFNTYWAKLAIEAGFPLKTIEVSRRDRNKLVFIFYNSPELMDFYEQLVADYRNHRRKEDQDNDLLS